MVLMEALLLAAVVLFLLYKWATAKYGVLKERGVPHEEPTPLIGNLELKVLLGKGSFIRFTIDRYLQNKHKKVYGVYNLRDPIIFVCDPELIKKVGIKDFDSFTNHRQAFSSDDGTIFSKSLLSLKDRRWKEMRSTLTPSFTGNKMRQMFELINKCSIEGVKYIDAELRSTEKEEVELEMKEYFTRYANDVIASAAFGIEVNSFKDRNNEFFIAGKTITGFKGFAALRAFLHAIIPKLMKALRVPIFDEQQLGYFRSLITDAMKYRQEHHIVRPDMIHLLMEAKRNFEESKTTQSQDHAQFTDDDLLAQCLLFFFAGFETVSNCLCLTTWELLMNPEIQEKLYEEILETEQQLEGTPLTYDVLMKMRYLDMVVSESLRKWPPVAMVDRLCSADYKLTDDDDHLLATIKKGDNIAIPIIGLHYDPEYFPNPSEFDPERFSEENKPHVKPMTYLPFGVGPRSCIGNRLAIMETKAIIYHMLLKYRIAPAERTCKDLMSGIRGFQLQPIELFPVKLIPRKA